MKSICAECSHGNPAEIASCPYCRKPLCDACFAARHENHKCPLAKKEKRQ